VKNQTALTKNVIAALDAYQYIDQAAKDGSPAMAMFSGDAGLGKSKAGEYLFIEANGLLVRCCRADTHGTLLQKLAQELGLEKRHSKKDMQDYIVQELAITGKPVFIDEADYLVNRIEVLEGIRDIYDLANVPIILIGYAQLPSKVKKLPQLASRIAQHVQFKKADIDDINVMAHSLIETVEIEDALLADLLHASSGNFRLIHTGLASIERFALANNQQQLSLQQWADRPYFPTIQS
jgi:DNA transposition AAA+ family ATPase